MAKAKRMNLWARIGVWSYLAGLIVALLVAIFSEGTLDKFSIGALAILGLIVGLINIGDSEVMLFLVASIAFIVAAGAMVQVFQLLGIAFTSLRVFMEAIIVFTAPGTLVVSFKALYEVQKDE